MKMDSVAACLYIEQKLADLLPEDLYYHGVHHTRDVVNAVNSIAENEGITDDYEKNLLTTAAYYHDSGFLNSYQNHEEEGCRIAQSVLPEFGYSDSDIAAISEMIMATKIPQSPNSQLARILCDADLDYLGRDDFEEIASTLYQELKARNLVTDTEVWDQIQIKFLSAHQYWTTTSVALREAKKLENLKHLIKL